jgi:hypothetical protein
MTQAGSADMTEGSGAHVTAAKMHAAEMAAATEVATTTVAAATATAGKGVRREAQRAKGDARQEHLCCLGHHDFPPDIGLRVCTPVHPNLCLCRETTSAALPRLRPACANARGNSVLALVRRGRDGDRTTLVLAVAAEAPTRRHDRSLATARCNSRSEAGCLTVPGNHPMLSLAGVEHRGCRPKQAA